MKLFSILLVLVLSSCATLARDKDEIKKIGHDIVDDSIDNAVVRENRITEKVDEKAKQPIPTK